MSIRGSEERYCWECHSTARLLSEKTNQKVFTPRTLHKQSWTILRLLICLFTTQYRSPLSLIRSQEVWKPTHWHQSPTGLPWMQWQAHWLSPCGRPAVGATALLCESSQQPVRLSTVFSRIRAARAWCAPRVSCVRLWRARARPQ